MRQGCTPVASLAHCGRPGVLCARRNVCSWAGRVCVAGFLGGFEPTSFNWLADMPFGVDVNAFASLLFGTKDFPHSDIPMQPIVDRVADGMYRTRPVKVFPFERIADAHRLMEANDANGKIVVVR